MPKLQQASEKQYSLTIPKMLVKAKGWKKGQEIEVKINKSGNLELRD